MTEPEWDAYAAAGLLDPDTADRRDLLAFLASAGASLQQMVEAHGRGRLFGLAGDQHVRPGGDRHSLAHAADLAGVPPELLARLWRALGLPGADDPLDLDVPLLADVDLAALPAWLDLRALVGDDGVLGLARVVGATAARLADATGSVLRRLGTLDLAAADEASTARAYAEVAARIPGLIAAFDATFRHQVDVARVLTEQAGGASDDGTTVRLAVGFGDLAGFTRLSAGLDHASLARLLDTFADVAGDVVRRHGGRVVKLVGDAVLFVAARPDQGALIGLDLLDAAAAHGLTGRAGLAYGPVLDRDGDVFGPVVNLAARLVAQAPDSEVLATLGLAQGLDAEAFVVTGVAPLTVRGYDDPVPAALVARRG